MAKKKQQPSVGFQAPMLAGMVASVNDKLNADATISDPNDSDGVGLPLPALCLRYLFQSNIFPLGRIWQLTGFEGSCKSSFLYEVFRWHATWGGMAVLAENENKDAKILRNGVMSWNEELIKRIAVQATSSLEEWQGVLAYYTEEIKQLMDNPDGGPGRTFPVCLGVDSITATESEAEIQKMLEAGHASRGFATMAFLITRFMRLIPRILKDYPMTIIGVNHLREEIQQMATAGKTTSTPGGRGVRFMETYEVQLKRAQNPDIAKQQYSGLSVQLRMQKNSSGTSRTRINADFIWWMADSIYGDKRQFFMWDWHKATVDLLLGFKEQDGKKTLYNNLREICDITPVSRNAAGEKTAWSNVLGIPKSDPVPFRVIGEALEQREDLLDQMYPLLMINKRLIFKPGQDFVAAKNAWAQESEIRTNKRVKKVDKVPTAKVLTTQDEEVAIVDEA